MTLLYLTICVQQDRHETGVATQHMMLDHINWHSSSCNRTMMLGIKLAF